MEFYQYLEQLDIHFVDYSGRIGLEEGLSRINELEKHFNKYKVAEKPLKVLMDARGYIKASPETHDTLAKISREKFDSESSNISLITAVLNDG